MKVGRSELEVLLPLIEMAREELADMEADDVPAGVRKASRSSARRLPPPLARSVFNELVGNDTFRAAVSERYAASGDTDDDLVEFLDRSDGAMERITDRAGAVEDVDMRAGLDAARERIEELESQLVEAKRRNSALVAQHARELGVARSSVSEGQVRAEARMKKMATAISDKEEEVSALEFELAALSNELTSTEERLASAIHKSRRRSEGGGQPGQRNRVDSTSSDPLELACWLDSVERNVRPFRATGAPSRPNEAAEPLRIDPGIAPDSALALASLIAQKPRRFLLDGYNIGGEIYADGFASRSARDDVVHRAGTLARSTTADVLVVFDGREDEGRSGFRSPGGVIVRFSCGDTADDMIAAIVASDPTGTVVVTNDRDLRSRCTVDGCVPIWSTAFLEWL